MRKTSIGPFVMWRDWLEETQLYSSTILSAGSSFLLCLFGLLFLPILFLRFLLLLFGFLGRLLIFRLLGFSLLPSALLLWGFL